MLVQDKTMNAFFRSRAAVAAALLAASACAQAADFTLSGSIGFHNDVVQIDFSRAFAGDVKIWTDSWMSGLNFDPTAALWAKSGADFAFLQAVDDDDTVAAGQGFYDSGFALPSLAAGAYRLTLAAAVNAPSGALLSQGFAYSAETPIPIGQWNQPTYDPNANDQKGGFWQVHFSNVDQAALAVPEPSSWLLLAVGLAALAARRGAGVR